MISGNMEINGLDEVLKMLENMDENVFEQTKTQFQKAGLEAQSNITVPMTIGKYGLQSRTGNLARSIKTSTTGLTLKDLSTNVYTKSIYALTHEKGATIRAKKAYMNMRGGPYLNIPTKANKTPAGVTRRTPRQVFAEGGYIGTAYVLGNTGLQ